MPTERTISSWAAVDWKDEMSQEELLAARIRRLKQGLEDVERAAEKLRLARLKNKGGSTRLTDCDQRRSRRVTGF